MTCAELFDALKLSAVTQLDYHAGSVSLEEARGARARALNAFLQYRNDGFPNRPPINSLEAALDIAMPHSREPELGCEKERRESLTRKEPS